LALWNSILEQLKLEIPIQYLLGSTSFYGLNFEVNENVLIRDQRQKNWWIGLFKVRRAVGNMKLKVLDIGTGSGCIAISLAKNMPNAKVYAIDVSEKALATAKKNAVINQVDVTFIEQNILETADLNQQFDIIVSNPPYVRNLEKQNQMF
jgi:release factor glutamine methyltransferase